MRKHVLLPAALILLLTTGLVLWISNHFQLANKKPPQTNQSEVWALLIPPELKDQDPSPQAADYELTAQRGTTEFFHGLKTETFGYNGNYLGPLIRMRKGEKVSLHIKNDLGEETTVHWHGLEVPGEMDGGPHNVISPGTVWEPSFTVNQPAATLWYHPHLIPQTGEQVYRGLAGLIYIEDEVSDQLELPKDYGKNDFPLILQDRRFDEKGRMPYDLGMMDRMQGFRGNTFLVNGTVQPYLNVPAGIVRLRILNGSNAKVYQLQLSDSKNFWQIASDGGFLEKPVLTQTIRLGAAERAEVLVDFSGYRAGDSVDLTDEDNKLMRFRITDLPAKKFSVPAVLTDIPRIDPSTAVRERSFVFGGMGSSVNINGKQMDTGRIDETLQLNTTEIWTISNQTSGMMGRMNNMAHPFHAHGVQFQLLERDGALPPENERGWKDTILLYPGEQVKAIATFKYPGIFMYHCHILEHEDAGMMGKFKVQ